MMTMQHIRVKYRIPIKRGMKVRTRNGTVGHITSASHYIRVQFESYLGGQSRLAFHPGDLDYFIDGEWKSGTDYIAENNRLIDEWNKRLNATKHHTESRSL